MVDWLRLVRGAKRRAGTPQPDQPQEGPPPLDPPDVVAERVARTAERRLKEWRQVCARTPDIERHKITRPKLEAELRAAGYRPRRIGGDTIFVKPLTDRTFGICPLLRTAPESDRYAPSQRLSLTGFVSLHRAAKVDRHLLPARNTLPATAHAREVDRLDFVLTREDAAAAVAAMDAALAALDTDAALARHRAFDPAQRGAGLDHLVALVLAGDADRLQAYVTLRDAGQTAGFWPYVTDAMIREAHALSRMVAVEGADGLDRHLAR